MGTDVRSARPGTLRVLGPALAPSLGFALLYALATALGRASHLPGMALAVAWPAAGVGFVWLAHSWRRPRARWTAAALLCATGTLAQLATSQRPLVAVLFALASTAQALVACTVHLRLQPAGFRLRQPRDLWALLIAACVGAGAGAVLGSTAAVLLLDQPPVPTALGWLVRHTTGTVVLAALWLRGGDRRCVPARTPWGGWVEYALVMAAGVLFFAALDRLEQTPLTFLLVPWAVWLGLRTPARVALGTVAVNDVLLVVVTREGSGPFAGVPAAERVMDVQLLVLVLTALTLMLVLHREERHRLDAVLRQALEDARASSRLLGTVFDTTAESLSVHDADGHLLMRNRAAREVLAGMPEDLDRERWDGAFGAARPDGAPWPLEDLPLARALRGEHVDDVDVLVTTAAAPGGRVLNLTAHPVLLDGCPGSGGQRGAVLAIRDVTTERAARERLVDSERRFRTAFDTAPVGMMIVGLGEDDAARILQVNSTLCTFTGLSADELLTRDFHDLTHPDDRPECIVSFAPFLLGELTQSQVEKRYRHADGSTRWGMLSATVMAAGEGGRPHLLCLIEDVTARKAAEEALRHQALHDALTGLPNRTLLHDRLEHALAAAGRGGQRVGVFFADLDGFKAVNDSAGHAAGDELLREVAARFSACLRPGDTLARLGGDEFAVICPGLSDEAGLRVIADRLLAALREPVLLASGTFSIGVSIGMSLAPAGADPELVLGQADGAMYDAKRAGRNRAHSHDGQERARGARASRLLPQLRAALDEDEFVLHGQPVVDLATGRVVAVETLLRWQHPTRGLLSPAEFLDVAEASPLVLGIGRRVLAESCRMAAAWSEHLGPDAPAVHVNVSGRQLEAGNLHDDALEALQRHGLPAHRLVLELTETHMPRITHSLLADVQRLRERGVRIAIDDLGTGYSSLARLTELPVDVLKIDLAFVAGLGVDPGCDAVVRAVLGIGQALELSVVAEGVETARQVDLLRSYGADTVQGYLYSPPRPERELVQHLLERRRSAAAAGAPRV
ncbi:EAL domain-containing protein [Kineococcus sp. SYSU DK006]|uniref:bifunctional diguanylate cyclase/phosphodiesterase n=1 Tax=Kineococcus sp. SYSU DK006 TaxID=3383127 RepID=UPI003D7C61CF